MKPFFLPYIKMAGLTMQILLHKKRGCLLDILFFYLLKSIISYRLLLLRSQHQ